MTCDIRYDSPMMTELATFPPLFWFSLAVCMAVIATYRLAGRTSRSTPLRVVFWTFAMIFVPTLAVIVMIAAATSRSSARMLSGIGCGARVAVMAATPVCVFRRTVPLL